MHSDPLVDENSERRQFLEYFRLLLVAIDAPGDHAALADEIDALHRSPVYEKARSLLGTDKAIFVDDWRGNVAGANALGIRGIHLLHPDGERDDTLQVITDLRELVEVIDR